MKRTRPVQPEGQRSDRAKRCRHGRCFLPCLTPGGGLGGGGARGVHGMGFRGAEASGAPWTPRRDGGKTTMTSQTPRKRGEPLAAARLPYVAHVRRLLDRLAPDGSTWWAWHNPESSEPRLRLLVAEHLGVDTNELTANVLLTEDLAADSLDLVELALVIEDEFRLTLPESMLTDVRTYGELVDVVQTLERKRCVAEASTEMPAYVSARLMPAREQASGDRHHGGWLTPYTAQAIVEDALGAGP